MIYCGQFKVLKAEPQDLGCSAQIAELNALTKACHLAAKTLTSTQIANMPSEFGRLLVNCGNEASLSLLGQKYQMDPKY